MAFSKICGLLALVILLAPPVNAQDLTIATVTRPPFSMVEDGKHTGFSIDLWKALAEDLGKNYEIRRVDEFQEMLRQASAGEVDAAVANISITASRESILDFSHPIFGSGLQIMVPTDHRSDLRLLRVIFSTDILLAIAFAFALLFGGGMLMWRLERDAQPYFDKTAKQVMFPAFWWALNLVVNGGFEERVPRTFFGRIFGVLLVLSSLFIVSIFVAKVTAVLTVDAIQSSINSVNDLYGKRVATIADSTASAHLETRELRYIGYPNLENMLNDFEAGELDAIVFDAPILAYYTTQNHEATLVGPVFLRENYGIAMPSESDLAEPLNRSLLKLRENGTYNRIYRKWFGASIGG